MWRNIFGQSIYQIGWLLAILLGGQNLFGLPFDKDTGFLADYKTPLDPSPEWLMQKNKTILYTIVFEAFVFM